jgi:tetratricopeptide (TPR) repeat protein
MAALSRPAFPQPRSVAAELLLRAGELHRRGEWGPAEDAYRRLWALDPRNVHALHLLGLLLTQTGRCEAGVELIDRALKLKPDYLDALNSRGNALQTLGRLEDALASYDRALKLNPRYADGLINRGCVLKLLLRHDEALLSFDRALSLAPNSAEAHQNRGATLRALQRHDEALAAYERALALRPGYFDAHFNRGQALLELRRFEEALAAFDRALALQPQHAEALCRRGEMLAELQRNDEALAAFRRAVAVEPANTKNLYNCGEILHKLHRYDEALALADRALAIAPDKPDLLNQRGNALQLLARPAEALAAYDRGLEVEPGSVVMLANRGNALRRLKRFDEALESYRRALELDPENQMARLMRGSIRLLMGDFASGWPDYEIRTLDPDWSVFAVRDPAPFWRGEALAGRSILVYDEQGLGDVLQFCRYLTRLAELGANTTFLTRPPLAKLMRMSFPAVRVLTQAPPGESFDFQSPLMSLPYGFGTTVDTVPGPSPYLACDPERVGKWRERLGAGGFRIGIAWQTSAQGQRHGRNFPLASLAPLAEIPGVRLISLQKGADAAALADLPQVESLGDDFDAGADAFLDGSAVMQCLDLVITPDTSLAHLAGALARPLWIALSDVADWRWLRDRADTPWYPTARLFRQSRIGDWSGVMADMAAALRERLAGRS